MDRTEEFFFQNRNYRILRILLSFSGLWPFYTFRRRCAIYLALGLVCSSGLVFQILGVLEVSSVPFELIDTLPLLFLAILTIARMFCMIYALPQIKVLLIKIKEYYVSGKSEEEARLHHTHAIYARNLTFVYSGLVVGHAALFNMMALMIKIYVKSDGNVTSSDNSQAIFAYRVNYMVDLDAYYAPIFIHTAVCTMCYVYLMVVCDVLYLTMIEHCCGLFAAVRYRLENAFEYKDESSLSMLKKDTSHANITYSIQRHMETMQFVASVDSMYRWALFMHVGTFVLVFSIVGYQMTMYTDKLNHFLKVVCYINALLINIFFENWQGQKIINFSERIFQSAYNVKWYNMPIATRKLLIMIMMRSKTPLIISAGKIIVMSYVTFNVMLRTSSSYCMLLRSV